MICLEGYFKVRSNDKRLFMLNSLVSVDERIRFYKDRNEGRKAGLYRDSSLLPDSILFHKLLHTILQPN